MIKPSCTSNANITVTSQADIDNGPLSSCANYAEGDRVIINIKNATGSLNFTTLRYTAYIEVNDNPRLERLDFPLLESSYIISVHNVDSLSNIFLPRLSTDASSWDSTDVSSVDVSVYITGAPSLAQLEMPYVTEISELYLRDVRGTDLNGLGGIKVAGDISSDFCPDLSSLVSFRSLWMSASGVGCILDFSDLTSFGDVTLRNISSLSLYSLAAQKVPVNGSLVLDGMTRRQDYNAYEVDIISTIGSNANITSNSNLTLDFSGLTTVERSLFVANNTNCTIHFDKLNTVGNLSIIDNTNFTIPMLHSLEEADNIHLRGYIDTSHGNNILPSLSHAFDTVIIEPWGDDQFNCSALLSQLNNRIINKLFCDGINNGTDTTSATSTPPTGLSGGAWAGIGIGIAVFVVGVVLAAVWFGFHFKRLLKDIEGIKSLRRDHNGAGQESRHIGITDSHQVEGQGIAQEKPDDQIQEMPIPPAEKPDDHIREMPSRPAELPGGT